MSLKAVRATARQNVPAKRQGPSDPIAAGHSNKGFGNGPDTCRHGRSGTKGGRRQGRQGLAQATRHFARRPGGSRISPSLVIRAMNYTVELELKMVADVGLIGFPQCRQVDAAVEGDCRRPKIATIHLLRSNRTGRP